MDTPISMKMSVPIIMLCNIIALELEGNKPEGNNLVGLYSLIEGEQLEGKDMMFWHSIIWNNQLKKGRDYCRHNVTQEYHVT